MASVAASPEPVQPAPDFEGLGFDDDMLLDELELDWPDRLAPGVSPPGPPALPAADMIDVHASYFRSFGTELGDLVAEAISGLAEEWRYLALGDPIGAAEFRARRAARMEGLADRDGR